MPLLVFYEDTVIKQLFTEIPPMPVTYPEDTVIYQQTHKLWFVAGRDEWSSIPRIVWQALMPADVPKTWQTMAMLYPLHPLNETKEADHE